MKTGRPYGEVLAQYGMQHPQDEWTPDRLAQLMGSSVPISGPTKLGAQIAGRYPRAAEALQHLPTDAGRAARAALLGVGADEGESVGRLAAHQMGAAVVEGDEGH